MKKVLLAALMLFLFACGGYNYEKGRDAYDRGDYQIALQEFRPLAEEGDASAQTKLGRMYEQGIGVPQNFVQAHKWYNLAAAQGIEHAKTYRDQLAERMTEDENKEARMMAHEWMEERR